ncbi:MAG: RagB/SusD family nutrient uptake outer membrane protein, partial [Sphingobacterium sp.]
MKNIVYNIFILASLLLVACQKGLDLIPKDTISDHTFWKTQADYKLAANNLYLSLEGFNTSDTESDIAFNDPNSISNGTYQTTENDSKWTDPYIYIRRCNNIIEKAAESPIASEIQQFVAEAQFFRAYN